MDERPFQFRWSRLLIVTVVAVLLGIAATVWNLYQSFSYHLRDVYVPISSAKLVIEHLKTHGGSWPKSWDELHTTFSKLEKNGYYMGFTWEEYLEHTTIDFQADPAVLATIPHTASGPPIRVIWSRAGAETRFPSSCDPTQVVLEYLRASLQNRPPDVGDSPEER